MYQVEGELHHVVLSGLIQTLLVLISIYSSLCVLMLLIQHYMVVLFVEDVNNVLLGDLWYSFSDLYTVHVKNTYMLVKTRY